MLHNHRRSKLAPASPFPVAVHADEKSNRKWWLFLLGVLLPLIALAVESQTHICARHYFDPIPSNAHLLLLGLIPLANLLVWLSRAINLASFYASIALISGMAMGVAVVYCLMLLPLAAIEVPNGLGLLALVPAISVYTLWRSGNILCQLAGKEETFFDPRLIKHFGHWLVLVTVILLEAPSTMTRLYLSMAADPLSQRQDCIALLRKYGREEVLWRACYERTGRATDILGSFYGIFHPVGTDNARRIFYQVTGKTFNSVPIPPSARATLARTVGVNDLSGANALVSDEFDLDPDVGGETVSGVARGLRLIASELAGVIEPKARLSTVEWTMIFANSSPYEREARATLLLPPAGVVNAASLWIDGKRRDAVILPKHQARSAYRQTVAERKSPLLVSYSGPDRVLVQFFPVPGGGRLKVSISIVAPVGFCQGSPLLARLPSFEERNFSADVIHKLRLRSTGPMSLAKSVLSPTASAPPTGTTSADANTRSSSEDRQYVVTGGVEDKALANGDCLVGCPNQSNGPVYTTDRWATPENRGALICQEPRRPAASPMPSRLTVVIDGSESMKQHIDAIREGLRAVPDGVPVELVLVSDVVRTLVPGSTSRSDPAFERALSALVPSSCNGGQLNESPLIAECAAHATDGSARVLWIHGAQPVLDLAVSHEWHTRARTDLLYDMQVASGPVVFLEELDRRFGVVRVERIGTISEDLKRLFLGWQRPDQAQSMQYRYLAPKYTSSVKIAPLAGSDALVQLWAADYVDQWLKTGLGDRFEECANLSASYHVVTPVSSAVVAQPEDTPQSAVADSGNYDFSISSDLSFGLTAPPDTRLPRMSFAGGIHRHRATIYDDEPIVTDGRSAGDELPGDALRTVYAPVSKADGSIAREPSSNLVGSTPVIGLLLGIATLLLAGLLLWARKFTRNRRRPHQDSPNRDAVDVS